MALTGSGAGLAPTSSSTRNARDTERTRSDGSRMDHLGRPRPIHCDPARRREPSPVSPSEISGLHPPTPRCQPRGMEPVPARFLDALSDVFDPCCREKGISVVDMGLVHSV